jgi:7-cyano-7-deazaguanine reductase
MWPVAEKRPVLYLTKHVNSVRIHRNGSHMSDNSSLGRPVAYPDRYAPELLYPIPRSQGRSRLGLGGELPFRGEDVLNAWELTWLDATGKPVVATAELRLPADSPNLIESKSLKLYLNSFAMARHAAMADVAAIIRQDLRAAAGADVRVVLRHAGDRAAARITELPGASLDALQVACDSGDVDPSTLRSKPAEVVSEQLYSHLLRSLCPVTSQPDIGSILIDYQGPRIERPGLLRYIVSFRQHRDFHETCVERMFVDIRDRCAPQRLTVCARYQRRGGIDINPFRSSDESTATNLRLWRQ